MIEKLERSNKQFKFFLSEIFPCQKDNSAIYLIGKTFMESNGKSVSTCLKILNVMREVYIMPKIGKSIDEVEKEIKILIQNKVKYRKIPIEYSRVKRKYCFELNVDFRDDEIEVLKLSYPFRFPRLIWLNQVGSSFKGVFGVESSIQE